MIQFNAMYPGLRLAATSPAAGLSLLGHDRSEIYSASTKSTMFPVLALRPLQQDGGY